MSPTSPDTRPSRRSNADRSQQTRVSLLHAARTLFVEHGYAGTSTPDIVRAAKVTRGALYHHFVDKKDLLRAVIQAEAEAVADQIEREAREPTSALNALNDGARGYFAAMSVPGRAHLLLIEGPLVLGAETMAQLNGETGTAELHEGLAYAMPAEARADPEALRALAEVLGAGFDAAAMAIARGEPAEPFQRALRLLFARLVEDE